MIQPDLSICIPHKPGRMNDQALGLNLGTLLAHTGGLNLEILIDATVPGDPYAIWNDMAKRANADVLIFTNSDVIMGPGWAGPYLYACEPNTIVTGYLVEPGNIGVASQNITMNFGRTPDTFDREAFEAWAIEAAAERPPVVGERGWYMPCAVDRKWFLSTGGFDTTEAFPCPNDIKFWDKCMEDPTFRLLRVNSLAYHFQNLTARDYDTIQV